MSRLASGRCSQGTAKLEASLPAGFQDQLNDVVRAVLLGQPATQIHCFIADFLDTQLGDRTQRELGRDQQRAPGKARLNSTCFELLSIRRTTRCVQQAVGP